MSWMLGIAQRSLARSAAIPGSFLHISLFPFGRVPPSAPAPVTQPLGVSFKMTKTAENRLVSLSREIQEKFGNVRLSIG